MTRSRKPIKRTVSKGNTRVVVGIVGFIGLTLSIGLHELFHALIHWGNISGIKFFPNLFTIIEVDVVTPKTYDTTLEEMVAYLITGFVMIVTIMIIWIIYDERRAAAKRANSQRAIPTKR